ncbi:uncharacterized protein M421DRAFT_422097 [Didymella exigua CBS 183.55]|uniref:Zn(2)-C6 fungal-type domain-containing protein n=1 Tax=Didymella exigua CBS 183.55 TaxID=1150837 RepID=A0A6A5RJG6_9PLEO|nr:uncharacterized protein M421DRAFT_422097 [Didymella exigua CBS 183.55]KAF1927248.1 hypothetical protein M421DRAFT_422097 [Didymella exigua CBS 183.55]
MVGVPGRSKGCVTCRKRKKGCDLQRPACGQCLERKIKCGGYDLDRVFITSKYEPLSPPASVRVVQRRDPTLDLVAITASTYHAIPPSLAQTAFSMKSMEAVFGLFPAHQDAGGALQLVNQFSKLLATLSVREEALRQTIFAVGLVTLGKGSNNQVVLRRGRMLYGKALQELRMSLQNPNRRAIEALLATTRLMGLYEILYGADADETISQQARNWMSHAQGEIALIVSRGPQAFTTDTAHLIFTLARYDSAITGIRSRKPIVFNEEQWKTIPWQGRVKTASDTIIDTLLELPGILAELDYLDCMSLDDKRFNPLRLKATAECWAVHCNLNAWIAKNSHEVYTPDIEAPIPLEFPNLGVASISLRYWITATILYQCLDRALRFSVNDTLPPYLNRPHGRPFARLIVRSVAWLFRKDNGVTGPSAVSFPLGVALMYLRQSEVPDTEYMKLVFDVWNDPEWPSSIKDFLRSMGSAIKLPTWNLPENPVTWSTSELKPIFDIDGNALPGPFEKPSRFELM